MSDDDIKVYTMRQLGNHTSAVMREISESGQPALVTLHGRFIAQITPLEPGQLEQKALAAIAKVIQGGQPS